jgi:hypothetical protein
MGQIDRDFEEKRNFIRMQMDSVAKLTIDGSNTLDVTCQNLSASGLSITANEPIALDTAVSITIPSPNAQFQPMQSNGNVIRCDKVSENQYQIGVEISSMI